MTLYFWTYLLSVLMTVSLSSDNDYSKSAVLMIDIQGLWTKNSIAGDFPDLGTNLQKLVQFARNNSILVVHLYADYNERDSEWFQLERDIAVTFENNPPDHDIMEPIVGELETVFNKSTFDGFYNTSLHEYLESKGIDTIYAAGVATSVCVTNTVNGAFIRGYNTYYVKNACGDDSQELHDLVITRYFRTLVVNIGDDGLTVDTSGQREDDVILDEDDIDPDSDPSSSETKQKDNTGMIAAFIVIGVVVALVVIASLFFISRRKRKAKKGGRVSFDENVDSAKEVDVELPIQTKTNI